MDQVGKITGSKRLDHPDLVDDLESIEFKGRYSIHYGTEIHRECVIGDGFETGHNVIVEQGCIIGDDVKIDSNSCLAKGTRVGDGTLIGPGVITLDAKMMEADESMRGPKIGRRCRIGAGAIIFPDVEIGDGAWIAAGAVVLGDVKPGSMVVGNPAEPLPGSEENKTQDWKELHEGDAALSA